MSYSASIVLDPLGDVAAWYCRLVEELQCDGSIYSISGMRAPQDTPIPVPGGRLLEDACRADANSFMAIKTELETRLPSGRMLPAAVRLYRENYQGGFPRAQYGPIHISFDYEALYDELWPFLRTADVGPRLLAASIAVRPEVSAIANRAQVDLESFFRRCCGLANSPVSTRLARTAAIGYEGRWPTPGESGVMFHQDPADFLRDYARIYAAYRTDVNVLATNHPDWRPLTTCPSNENAGERALWKDAQNGRIKLISAHDHELLECMHFFETISCQIGQEMWELADSSAEMVRREILRSEGGVEVVDHGERGVSWSTGWIFGGVWRKYRNVLLRLRGGKSA